MMLVDDYAKLYEEELSKDGPEKATLTVFYKMAETITESHSKVMELSKEDMNDPMNQSMFAARINHLVRNMNLMDSNWRALAGRIPSLKPEGFMDMFRIICPGLITIRDEHNAMTAQKAKERRANGQERF